MVFRWDGAGQTRVSLGRLAPYAKGLGFRLKSIVPLRLIAALVESALLQPAGVTCISGAGQSADLESASRSALRAKVMKVGTPMRFANANRLIAQGPQPLRQHGKGQIIIG
jgi:hypothetical protein